MNAQGSGNGIKVWKQGQSFLGARNTKGYSVTRNTESVSETRSVQMTTEEFRAGKLIMCGVR